MSEQEIAVALTAALMTGERASERSADRAVDLYRHMLNRLKEPAKIDYRGKPGLETSL